jgi:nicotinate-nucleotide--dimethylbenzimidazole phosphoribosyltransferase
MAVPSVMDEPMKALLGDAGGEPVLPAFDVAAAEAAQARQNRLTKPRGALGRLEAIAVWLAGWQRREVPCLERPHIAIFVGWHGIAAKGVSAYPAEVTGQMLANFRAGGAAINQLARSVGATLEVLPVFEGRPTRPFDEAPAMSGEACRAAVAIGRASLPATADLLVVGEMGIANTSSAAAIAAMLHDEPGERWAGPGTGLAAEGVARKAALIDRARALHGRVQSPAAVLRCVGGHEIAAMAGAILEARLRAVPVLLDGFVATAAAAVLHRIDPAWTDHCLAGHRSAEPGHAALLDRLGLEPLLALGMRLGEGTGAALAIPLVRAALACHAGMASFDAAGVSDRGPR